MSGTRSGGRAQRRASERRRNSDERRRRAERAVQRAERRRRNVKWGLRVGLGALGAAVVVFVVGLAVHLIGDALKPGPGHLPPIAVAQGYRVDYTTVYSAGNPVTTDQEERLVERPFESLDLSRRDGQLISGAITNDQGFYEYTQGSGWALLVSGRQAPQNDLQPYGGLSQALKVGLARVVGTENLAGEKCTNVRTGAPVGEAMKKPTGSNHVDICLDSHGVVLSYVWTLNGKRVETMTASHVQVNPPAVADEFNVGPGKVNSAAEVHSIPLTPQQLSETSPKLIAPAGFVYSAGTLQAQQDPLTGGLDLTTELLFVQGQSELYVVDYFGQPLSRTGEKVNLGAGKTGYLQLGLDSNTLIVPNGPDASVRFMGADPSLLIEMARGLQ